MPANIDKTAPQGLFALHFWEFSYHTFFRLPPLHHYQFAKYRIAYQWKPEIRHHVLTCQTSIDAG